MHRQDASKTSARPTGHGPNQLRKLGIGGLCDVPWGAHLCQFYLDNAELLETLVPYFAAGLESNEFCMWITSETLASGEAEAALQIAVPHLPQLLDDGQIEILDFREWYKMTGCFDPDRVRQGWMERLDLALARGFDGLRFSGDTSWLSDDEWDHFVHYEARLDPIVGASRILAICTYALPKCNMPKTFDVVANHDFALVREDGRWGAFKSFGRRRTEQASRESETRLRATIEGATDGIVTIDQNGVVTLANPAAAKMFGYALDELLGESIVSLLPQATRGSRERSAAHLLRIAERGFFGRRREASWRHKDGSTVPVEWAMSDISLDHQKLFVICVHNLTERRQVEARLQQLHRDRLLAMGGMATALAHEINQPLTATAAYLKVARRIMQQQVEGRSAVVEDALDKASEQILRAGDIIRHMREFVARSEPDKTIQRLHDLIAAACELTMASAKQANVKLCLALAADDDLVLADTVQLKQVVVNLVRNAIEAMHAVQRRELSISTVTTGKGTIRTDIADTGPGLSEERRARLFEPFETTKTTGLGVGLSLSRSIIEAHYGEIWAEPNPGGGAVFRFTLPLAE